MGKENGSALILTGVWGVSDVPGVLGVPGVPGVLGVWGVRSLPAVLVMGWDGAFGRAPAWGGLSHTVSAVSPPIMT